ncbi:Receptor-like serine/threonine-protein kinase SD1-8 [Apostasia shenzhenica]|uniref:non-specific serine/threonine protein kinase n=1 Tax=Apostasia shenzhenica TaxID=1088818 RepID=A0A2H9ZXB8_9ASPA|nr:Receptor-like serine/threonine-protein kinase SD1-8 [Apostasia shenzhenica]
MEILARLSLLFLSLLVLPHSANAGDTLTPSKPLSGNRTLISPTGLFALGFFTPAGTNNTYVGVWYNNIRLQTIVWVANRNTPVAAEATLFISRNGTLLITDSNSTVIWSSVISAPLNNSLAELLDNGNFVVREADSAHRFAWQSFDYPTDTIIPGMKIGVDFGAGINHSVAAWRSGSDPAAGSYTAAIDVHGDPQIFLRSGSESLWRSGPWNGFQFSGVPEITSYRQLSISFFFVNTKEEVSYSFLSTNKSIVTRLLLNQSGKLQRAVWVWDTEQWNFFWQAPGDQCDIYAACGPFGVCDPDESPVCDCLRGFTPMDPTKWALQDGSGGCRRMTALDCRNLTDGFVTLAGAKLPDTALTAVDMSMGLDKCRETCLRNCSCTAFAVANLSSESGCLIWVTDLVDIRRYSGGGGQDLYVRLAAADLGAASGGHHHSKKSTAVIVSCVLVAVFLAFVAVGCFWGLRKRRKQSKSLEFIDARESILLLNFIVIYLVLGNNNFHGGRVMGQEEHRDSSCELPCFQLADLAAAIDYFSEENKLGEGGFGPVYKPKFDGSAFHWTEK